METIGSVVLNDLSHWNFEAARRSRGTRREEAAGVGGTLPGRPRRRTLRELRRRSFAYLLKRPANLERTELSLG